jgi:hypothetical protein
VAKTSMPKEDMLAEFAMITMARCSLTLKGCGLNHRPIHPFLV